MSLVDVERLREIAEVEFADIVVEAWVPDLNELRIILTDSSFMDVWFSLKLQDRYSLHWERGEQLMGRSTVTTMHCIGAGKQWQSFLAIFITGVKPTSQKVISAKSLKKPCGNSWRLHETG